MDPHGGRVDRETGGGPGRLTEAARAALAALGDAIGRLRPASRERLGDHLEQEIEDEQGTETDRHGPPRGDPG
jgi:hypothetical protein